MNNTNVQYASLRWKSTDQLLNMEANFLTSVNSFIIQRNLLFMGLRTHVAVLLSVIHATAWISKDFCGLEYN